MLGLAILLCCGVMLVAMGFFSGLGWGWIAFMAVMLVIAVAGVAIS